MKVIKPKIDRKKEIDRLFKELDRKHNLWEKVSANLSNENFIKNAPKEIQEREQKKWEDTLNMILYLEDRINNLINKL